MKRLEFTLALLVTEEAYALNRAEALALRCEEHGNPVVGEDMVDDFLLHVAMRSACQAADTVLAASMARGVLLPPGHTAKMEAAMLASDGKTTPSGTTFTLVMPKGFEPVS